jgi:hypothetical protein
MARLYWESPYVIAGLEPCQLPSSGDARAPVSIIMATTNRIEECCYLASVLVTAVIALAALAQPA